MSYSKPTSSASRSSASTFDEASWMARVKPLFNVFYDQIPDRAGLRYLEEILKAPDSYWNKFNLRLAAAIEKPGFLRLPKAQVAAGAERLNRVRDAFQKEGSAIFVGTDLYPGYILFVVFDTLEGLNRTTPWVY